MRASVRFRCNHQNNTQNREGAHEARRVARALVKRSGAPITRCRDLWITRTYRDGGEHDVALLRHGGCENRAGPGLLIAGNRRSRII
jgi:hypothetical protein